MIIVISSFVLLPSFDFDEHVRWKREYCSGPPPPRNANEMHYEESKNKFMICRNDALVVIIAASLSIRTHISYCFVYLMNFSDSNNYSLSCSTFLLPLPTNNNLFNSITLNFICTNDWFDCNSLVVVAVYFPSYNGIEISLSSHLSKRKMTTLSLSFLSLIPQQRVICLDS